MYDAAACRKKVLFAPGDNPQGIDLTLAQWSPQGDSLLLPGATLGRRGDVLDLTALDIMADGDYLQFSYDGKTRTISSYGGVKE